MISPETFIDGLKTFHLYPSVPRETIIEAIDAGGHKVLRYINEYWTSEQRKASRIHEISYRACFKPQLPRFFITRLTGPGDVVYDPFSGRGTTPIEAGLLGRSVISNDSNPLSLMLTRPRFFPPNLASLKERLDSIPQIPDIRADLDLSMFYHPGTEAEIVSLRNYLIERDLQGTTDDLDAWIRMVATNRLTGHSPGFFSVYTLPPNQAVLPERQRIINQKRNQVPEYRNTRDLILKKSRSLISSLSPEERRSLIQAGTAARSLTCDARKTSAIPSDSVQLTVTSPPFLNIVQYSSDNWLRCWFNSIPVEMVSAQITQVQGVAQWRRVMGGVFHELFRVTSPGGYVAFEVGEVRSGTISLDEVVVPLGIEAGFTCLGVVVNLQDFTKTSNIWGVSNMQVGTNSNRIVMFYKNCEMSG